MKINKQTLEKYYLFLHTACLGVGSLLLINAGFGSVWSPFGIILCSCLCLALLQWTKEHRAGLPIWGGLSLFLFLLLYLLHRNESAFHKGLSLTVMLLCCLASGLISLAFTSRILLKAFLVSAQLITLFIYAIRGMELSRVEVLIIFSGFLLCLCELAQYRKSSPSSIRIIHLTPLLLLALLPLLFLPVHQEPIKWKAVKHAANVLAHQIRVLRANTEYLFSGSSSTYSLPFTGFDENGGLGGDIYASDLPQLTINGTKTFSPLYLTGSIRNTYTGTGWEQRTLVRPYSGEEYLLASRQLSSALDQSTFTLEERDSILHNCAFELQFSGLKTKTLFLAPMTSQIFFSGKAAFQAADDSPVMDKAQGIGFFYRFYASELNYGSEKTKQFLRGDAWKSVPQLSETLAAREAFIHREYTRLPATLPDRVHLLAEELTAGCTTDYDKLAAIQDYLSAFTYTTSPGKIPEGRDFTDYFLFDSQTGYCTYFATAMAVLSRSAGIPTRYAEGFITAGTRRSAGTPIKLTGSNAHAWTEAYIDGIGWIIMDATPSYNTASITAWPETEAAGSTGTSTPFRPAMPDDTQAQTAASAGVTDTSTDWGRLIALTTLLLLSAALLPVSMIVIRRHMQKHRYNALTAAAKMTWQLQRLLILGRLQGYPLKDGETLTAYHNRVNTDGMLDGEDITFLQIIDLYQRIRFGGAPILSDSVQQMEAYVAAIESSYVRSCGRLKRFLYYL